MRVSSQLESSAAPASPDFSGWNWVAVSTPCSAAAGALITWAEHGEPFAAAAEQGVLAATQFHPEKSGDAGAAVLSNWLETI